MRSSTWLPVLVLLAGLGIGRTAHAGAKMDWSEYLEPPGYKAPLQVTSTPRPAKAAPAPKKVSKAVAKKASKAKSKKAKRSARKKSRR